MLHLLRTRNFALLWWGGLISNMGDWMLLVGLSYEVYRRTESTLGPMGTVVSFLLPSILLGSIAGVFVDRWDRRRLMVWVNVVLAILLLPLLLLNVTGVWIAFLVLTASSCVEQLFQPAQVALVPRLIEDTDAELIQANSLIGVSQHLSRLIGPAIGGVLFAVGGLLAVVLADAASFLFSAAMIALIRGPSFRPVRTESLEHAATSAWHRLSLEWRDGLRVMRSQPILRALLYFMSITRIGEGLTIVLFVPWVVVALHSDQAGYGALLSTQAIGAIFAGILGTVVPVVALLILQGSGYVIGGLLVFALTRGQRVATAAEPEAG